MFPAPLLSKVSFKEVRLMSDESLLTSYTHTVAMNAYYDHNIYIYICDIFWLA